MINERFHLTHNDYMCFSNDKFYMFIYIFVFYITRDSITLSKYFCIFTKIRSIKLVKTNVSIIIFK